MQKRAAKTTINVIDVPGHDKLRFRAMDSLNQTKRIVLVIDSANIFQKARPAAELLADLLMERGISKNAVPVLVCCNKQDDFLAQSASKVKSMLEYEM